MTTRVALGAVLVMTLGLAFVPLGCENWNRPTFTHIHPLPEPSDPREIPRDVLEQLEACVQGLPAPAPSEEASGDVVGFSVHADKSGHVRAVSLMRSTLADKGVEACMVRVVQGMALPVRELRQRMGQEGGKPRLSPEARTLLADDPEEMLQMLPAALSVAGRVVVVVLIIWAVYEVAEAILAPAAATPTVAPTAAAAPKTRKYPNQTCDDDDLAKLEAEKAKLCGDKYAVNCKGNRRYKQEQQRLDSIPCSTIMRSLDQRIACLRQRNLIEDLCFGGIPDDGHMKQLEDLKLGIGHCEELKNVNCAPGHPMSGL